MYYLLYLLKNNNMNNEEYDEIIKSVIVEDNIYKNMLISFISGGLIGILGEFLTNIYLKFVNLNDAYLLTFITFVVVGSALTGLGIFDKVLSICKCGLIVPSTGFANSMTSSAMDYKKEGFIKGIGANIFKLTGSIILYGIVFGILFGYIRSII